MQGSKTMEKLNAHTAELMDRRFGHDNLIAIATECDHTPYVRAVNTYYEDGSFYVITHALSGKMQQLSTNPKIAICGNGAASKEQVAMMIQKTLKVELDPKYLDATDALAIALCHHYQMTNPLAGTGAKTDWKKFLTDNPDRIKK